MYNLTQERSKERYRTHSVQK